MLPIQKLPAPQDLIEFIEAKSRDNEIPTYDEFKSYMKERNEAGIKIPATTTPFYQLRLQLLQEQKYVCAYCGQQVLLVENENGKAQMKTEHFKPQNGTPENDLNYQNLLACCLGNDNNPGENHCDSMKSDGILIQLINPANLDIRDDEIIYIVYPNQEEVAVGSANKMKTKELTGKTKGCLNLNHDRLKRDRFSVYKNEMQRPLGNDEAQWDMQEVEAVKAAYLEHLDGFNKKYKDFVLWYLEDWLRKNRPL